MSAVDEELSSQLKNWNPMRDDYKDSRFNTYSSGPGADLDASHQPAELAKQSVHNQKEKPPFLVFKFVPTTLTLDGLMNICSAYGKCLRARKHGANMYFIDFDTINDMERVFTGLQHNSYGFRVELAKNKDPQQNNQQVSRNAPLPNVPSFPTNQIDYNRSYQVSSRNAPRPQFKKEPIVNKEDYENPQNNLSRNDPQRHFMIEHDAHDLERVSYVEKKEPEDGKYNYHTGRAYYTMPHKGMQFIKEKQKTTVGNFDAKRGFFQNKPEAFETKIKIGPCEHCKKNCDMVCPRCMSFFCNEECQKAEWSRHRYVCGKPISMWPTWAKHLANQRNPTEPQPESKVESSPNEPQQDSSKKAALKAQLPASGNNVIVTAISKTNVVFVRSTLYEDNLKFFDTISKVQKEAKDQSSIQHTPGRGDIVFTKFKDDQYNRAMILNPDDLDKIKLIYIDYGNIDTKRLDDLYDAPEKFWNLPRMAVPIILKDVPEFTMTEEVKKYMFSYLNTDMKIVYDEDDFENGVNIAELFDLTGNESFNKTITTFTAGAIDQKKASVVYREFLEHSRLPTGTNVELLVIDNSLLQTGFVSCTTEEYAQEIQNLQSDVQKYAQANKSKSSYTPRVNELCIAKYSEDNLWYRGRCIEVVGDGHPTILFIDYGNLCIVSVDDIMKYPEEFTFPIMTADCDIKGMPDKINDELKTKLEELLEPGTKLTCDSVEYFEEENIYSIYLKDLLKKVLP